MKKMLRVLLGIMLVSVLNVKADAGPPMVASYEIIVNNKNGAVCYSYNDNNNITKTDKVVPYGSVYTIYEEYEAGYFYISEEGCSFIKISDAKPKKDTYSLDSNDVTKVTPTKAVILANGGLNMRKGPSTVYGKIMTIPQYAVVTIKYEGGTYWRYVEYNGKSGWISGINSYFGFDSDSILFSNKDVKIYDYKDKKKVIGTIPALTEITDYIEVLYYHSDSGLDEFSYYVNYNGIKGLIDYMPLKVDGEVKLNKDYKLYDKNDKVLETIKKGTSLKFSIITGGEYGEDTIFYIPSKNGFLKMNNTLIKTNSDGGEEYVNVDNYTIVKEEKTLKKTRGFIGEGLFGEKKTTGTPNNEPENNNQNNNQNNEVNNNEVGNDVNNTSNEKEKTNNTEILIICILGGIVLALTAVIIILLINKNKEKKVESVSNQKEETKKEIVREETVKEEKEGDSKNEENSN